MYAEAEDMKGCESVFRSLWRAESQGRGFRLDDSAQVEAWRPQGARKERARQFATFFVGDQPLYVAKLPTSRYDSKVSHEYQILQRLQTHGVNVADPLQEIGDGFVMRHLPGRDLPEVLSTAKEDVWFSLVNQVIDRLASLHRSFLGQRENCQRDVVVREYVGNWEPPDQNTRRALAVAQVGGTHGDLGPWNIRYDELTGQVAFLDWEDHREVGLPALDVLNFVATLPLLLTPDYRTIGFQRLYELSFAQTGRFGHLAAAGLNRYAISMGIRARDVLALLPLYCEAMNQRLRDEGRSTEGFFYTPFRDLFVLEEVAWLDTLEEPIQEDVP